jgi:hypothetical protein
VGLADGSAILGLATGSWKVTEVARWMGVKVEAEQRFVEAARWYRLALESGTDKTYESRWAFDRSSGRQGSGMGLSRLAKDAR